MFKVKTLDGDEVWRRRRYRVRQAQAPGSFNLSVLDNGVTSKEFWRLLDASDDLSFALFYYSGAASAAGERRRLGGGQGPLFLCVWVS